MRNRTLAATAFSCVIITSAIEASGVGKKGDSTDERVR